MNNKQKLESCPLEFHGTVNFSDLDMVEQVVEEAFFREPKNQEEKHSNLTFHFTFKHCRIWIKF